MLFVQFLSIFHVSGIMLGTKIKKKKNWQEVNYPQSIHSVCNLSFRLKKKGSSEEREIYSREKFKAYILLHALPTQVLICFVLDMA